MNDATPVCPSGTGTPFLICGYFPKATAAGLARSFFRDSVCYHTATGGRPANLYRVAAPSVCHRTSPVKFDAITRSFRIRTAASSIPRLHDSPLLFTLFLNTTMKLLLMIRKRQSVVFSFRISIEAGASDWLPIISFAKSRRRECGANMLILSTSWTE